MSAGLVWGAGTVNYASPDDLDTITYAMVRPEPDSGSLEPRTKDVPIAWHESLQLAFTAQEKIREAGLSSLVESFVVPGSYDEPEATVSISATDRSVSETIESLTSNVTVNMDIVEEIPPKPESDSDLSDGYQVSNLEPERVPGGVLCESDQGFGTLTSALFDAESQSGFFATSNHVFGEAGTKETEHRGEPLSLLHDGESYHVGDVVRGYPEADVVQVAPVDEYRPSPEIERASPRRVIGQYTGIGLADLMAREEPLTKVGALSDRTTGAIKGVNAVTCYTGEACKPGQLKWGEENTLIDGDSGSLNFHEDPENPDDYLIVGGINNARTWWPGADFTWGTAAHQLLEEYGLHF